MPPAQDRMNMSIRLRLTLLYSALLAITLIVFSTTLYLTQAQITLNDLKTNLTREAGPMVNGLRRFTGRNDPLPSGNFPLPGRWTQLRNADGVITAHTNDLSDSSLPLSDAGLKSVQSGKDWYETADVQDQPLLIYSTPVTSQSNTLQIVQVATPVSEREQSLNTLRLILSIGSAIVILIAFGAGWFLSGAALEPINRITHTAQAIGADRNFSRRVDHKGPKDEVGQLATTFNTMLSELETAYRQLQKTLESQRRFVADASHELRTPLTTVRGNIELLKNNSPMDAKERADVLSDTKDEIERLIRLVNQLLILARSDAGRMLPLTPVPIRPLLEDACRQAKLIAPERTIICDSSLDVTALGDHDALKQVLVILLDNALVHTAPTATVRLSAELEHQHIAIKIKDSGAGIASDRLPHIFERFYRGDSARSGAGMGLGLSIAKELTEAQKGTIHVSSQPGQGSTFTIVLPSSD